jgi:hypothetical protein
MQPPAFNPYAPPTAESLPELPLGVPLHQFAPFVAYARGRDLVMSPHAPLANICVKCGARDSLVRRQHSFKSVPMWPVILLPLGCAPTFFFMLLLARTIKMPVPLCATCNARWSRGTLLNVIWLFVLFLSFVGPPIALALGEAEEMVWLVVWPAAVFLTLVAYLVVYFAVVRPRAIALLDLDDYLATFGGVHDDARAAVAHLAHLRAQMGQAMPYGG